MSIVRFLVTYIFIRYQFGSVNDGIFLYKFGQTLRSLTSDKPRTNCFLGRREYEDMCCFRHVGPTNVASLTVSTLNPKWKNLYQFSAEIEQNHFWMDQE